MNKTFLTLLASLATSAVFAQAAAPAVPATPAETARAADTAVPHDQRVEEQAQPAEQQHLHERLAERRPRREHLGQADRKQKLRGHPPPHPAQPPRQPGE